MLKHFTFSPGITIACIVLAGIMIRCSVWQWERYLYKKELVATYEANSTAEPLPFPSSGNAEQGFPNLLHKKVSLSGTYDFEHQMIVINRKHVSGPGYWLLTPLRLDGLDEHVIVSRGFIPFEDREPETWRKYDEEPSVRFQAVVQPAVGKRTFLSPKSASGKAEWNSSWLYPDIQRMASQLPYETIASVFVQRLGAPASGTFPAEAITVRVPPQTHFGYTIEWALLALATLVVGILIQAFPRRKHPEKLPITPPAQAG